MNDRHDVTLSRRWLRDGEAFLADTVHRLADEDLRRPSLLPGWSRAHVIGHLARNAEALTRLATWARTAVETRMYRDRDQRAAEIEASARGSADKLRQELASRSEELARALDALNADHWRYEVRSALDRSIPAAEIPWLRVREVWLHAVDLSAGSEFTDLPASVVDALLDDVTGTLVSRTGCPTAHLEPDDRDRTWCLGAGDGTIVRGEAADTLGWLVGRTDGASLTSDEGRLPPVPRWL